MPPQTLIEISAYNVGNEDWAVQHCDVRNVPVVGENGALHELLPRWKRWDLGDEKAGRAEIIKSYREGYQSEQVCHGAADQREVEAMFKNWRELLKEHPAR